MYTENPHLARLLCMLIVRDANDINTCCRTLNNLRTLLAMASISHQIISMEAPAFSQLLRVSGRYFELFKKKTTEALLGLEHYLVTMEMVESFWFMRESAVNIWRQRQQSLELRL